MSCIDSRCQFKWIFMWVYYGSVLAVRQVSILLLWQELMNGALITSVLHREPMLCWACQIAAVVSFVLMFELQRKERDDSLDGYKGRFTLRWCMGNFFFFFTFSIDKMSLGASGQMMRSRKSDWIASNWRHLNIYYLITDYRAVRTKNDNYNNNLNASLKITQPSLQNKRKLKFIYFLSQCLVYGQKSLG